MKQENNELAVKLLEFYDREARVLPFRINPVPYYIWISEIMLQQTRMEFVIPYFNRFIEALPQISDLAEVDEERLMKLWEGLGYYSRARNLKKAAGVIMSEHNGEMPSSFDELSQLPGIGPYTAGAIASIAFGRAVPAVDGNVMRVFSRVRAYDEPVMTAKGRRFIHDAVVQVMPRERPGDFNQAIMELGAVICLPNGAPLCLKCPIRLECKAGLAGNPLKYPVLPVKKPRRMEEQTVLLIIEPWAGEGLFLLETRPKTGLLSGLDQFPMRMGHLSEDEVRDWLSELGITDYRLSEGIRARHIFSHIEWHMKSFVVELKSGLVRENWDQYRWVSGEDLDRITLPTAFKAFRKELAALFRSASDAVWNGINPIS